MTAIMMLHTLGWLVLGALGIGMTPSVHAEDESMTEINAGETFPVVELRRYVVRKDSGQAFARYFETWFPEAFRQLGAMVFGQFLERGDASRFTWVRGFPDMDAQARINAEFYYGPLWKEHKAVMRSLMIDTSDVLLLRPLRAGSHVPVLRPVDPLADPDLPRGLAVLQIFHVRDGMMSRFASRAEEVLASYEADGVRNAGVLVTLDAPNNFPQLPVREDGPYLVWLGIVESEEVLRSALRPVIERAMPSWRDGDLLEETPELIVMDPTARSRLRWLAR